MLLVEEVCYIYIQLACVKLANNFLVSCPSLNNPTNGMIASCTLGDDNVTSYEDTCSFTCNTGYELTGSDTRTCQGDGSWSGAESDDVCGRGSFVYSYAHAKAPWV